MPFQRGDCGLAQRVLERRLVGVDEALRQVVDRLPDALGKLGRGVVVLDVLLDELAAVGAERGVEVLHGLRARRVHGPARLAHRVERAHDVLLAADDIQRRQLPQPRATWSSRDTSGSAMSLAPDVRNPNMSPWRNATTTMRRRARSTPRGIMGTTARRTRIYSRKPPQAQNARGVGYNSSSSFLHRAGREPPAPTCPACRSPPP